MRLSSTHLWNDRGRKENEMNELKFYPSNKAEALAYLYMEKQDLTDKTPEEVVEMYNVVYDKMVRKMHEIPVGKPKVF